MSGICFVGYVNHAHRIGFLLIPVGVCAVVGLVFLVRGLLLCLFARVLQLEMYAYPILSRLTLAGEIVSGQIVCDILLEMSFTDASIG